MSDDSAGKALPRVAKLQEAIAQEHARLARLGTEHADAQARLATLRAELASFANDVQPSTPPSIVAATVVPRTPAEKVRLFRSLFRGRPDIFPTRFVSKKTGKPGYAPACANKFVPGVCALPAIRCGECPNQAFRPANDQAVLDHLRGRHIMGVYPLLDDETCWFLAADFDKASWRDDVSAFVATCRKTGVPVATERSRSGNGAHAWIFFAAPVPAVAARKMGCYLITETMARHHQLAMDSYDRFFPNQDTMPRGGFGTPPRWPPSKSRLDAMIEEATVDAHDESEQRMGFFAVMEECLQVPFVTDVLRVAVTVERIDLTEADEIVAICRRGKARQAIAIVDLPLPKPRPRGAEWIEAYRRWAGGG